MCATNRDCQRIDSRLGHVLRRLRWIGSDPGGMGALCGSRLSSDVSQFGLQE